ncbi:MAG: zinc-dependent metalloprotease [Parabacteroides sp.]|nr:zinc-dependent metalloprotease [Parabacteroides sp.]
MKTFNLCIVLLCISTFAFAQTRVDIGEIYGAQLKKTVQTTNKKIYRINAKSLLNAPKSDGNLVEVKMTLFNQDYDIELTENTVLQNTPSFYTDENGIRHQDYPNIKLYAGHLKSDSSKYVRFSIIDERYLNGYINVGDDFLYLSSLAENNGNTIAYYGNDVISSDSGEHWLCGTPEPDLVENELLPLATELYDFESVIRIMKIAADADADFFNIHGNSTNAQILSAINEIEGLYAHTFNIAFQVTNVHYFQSANVTGYPYTANISDGGKVLVTQMKNYWNSNSSNIDRNVAMLFSGKSYTYENGLSPAGIACAIGGMANKSTSYMITFNRIGMFLTTAHELGHLCNGKHEDCQYGGTTTASVMCQGTKKNPPYFSNASIARIGQHIYSNNYLQKVSVTSNSSFVNNSTNVTFTASPFPAGMFTWSGHPMDLVSTSGASATFKTGRDGTSYATIKTASGASMSGSVYVGKPVITIEGPNRTPNTGYAKYRAEYDGRCSPTSFEWILNPQGNNSVYGANTSTFDIAFYQTGSYQIVVRAANKYGMGEYTVSGVTVYDANNSAAMIAYPNPANQTLYVDFSSVGEQQAKAINSVPVQQKQYDIRLFNLQGSLVRSVQSKGEQISFDVSGLPGGNYFLHIYDGESQKPLVQQIVIKH